MNRDIFNMQIEIFRLIIERSSDLKENLVQLAKNISQHLFECSLHPLCAKKELKEQRKITNGDLDCL